MLELARAGGAGGAGGAAGADGVVGAGGAGVTVNRRHGHGHGDVWLTAVECLRACVVPTTS